MLLITMMIITHIKSQRITVTGVIDVFVGSDCGRFTVNFFVSNVKQTTHSVTESYVVLISTSML